MKALSLAPGNAQTASNDRQARKPRRNPACATRAAWMNKGVTPDNFSRARGLFGKHGDIPGAGAQIQHPHACAKARRPKDTLGQGIK